MKITEPDIYLLHESSGDFDRVIGAFLDEHNANMAKEILIDLQTYIAHAYYKLYTLGLTSYGSNLDRRMYEVTRVDIADFDDSAYCEYGEDMETEDD